MTTDDGLALEKDGVPNVPNVPFFRFFLTRSYFRKKGKNWYERYVRYMAPKRPWLPSLLYTFLYGLNARLWLRMINPRNVLTPVLVAEMGNFADSFLPRLSRLDR